jgi:hypothetical protein
MTYIPVNPYKSSYFAAIQELERRKAELQFISERISRLEETIKLLEPLANEEGVSPTAPLPELCQQILMFRPGVGMTVGMVMESLAQMGVDISGYSQPLAVLHTTLLRICKPGSGFVKIDGSPRPCYMYDETKRKIHRFPRVRELPLLPVMGSGSATPVLGRIPPFRKSKEGKG